MNKILISFFVKFEKYFVGVIIGILLTLLYMSKCFEQVTITQPIKFTLRIPEIKVDSTLIDSIENLKAVNDYLRRLIKQDSSIIKDFYKKKEWKMNDKHLEFTLGYRGKIFPEYYNYIIKEKEIVIDTFVSFKVRPVIDRKAMGISFLLGVPLGMWIYYQFFAKKK